MKSKYKSIAILILVVYAIPVSILYLFEPHQIATYFVTSTVGLIPAYPFARYKRMCKIAGIRLQF